MSHFGNEPQLQESEVRVIKTDRKAIVELLFETLFEIGHDRFDIPADSDEVHFSMKLDDDMETLTFLAYFWPEDGEAPNLKYIDDYISKNVGKTTDSFFYTNGDTKKRYVTLFLDKPAETADDSSLPAPQAAEEFYKPKHKIIAGAWIIATTPSGYETNLQKNEVRVIKTDRKAIVELLFETLLEIGYRQFDIPADSDEVHLSMKLDDAMETLTFFAYFWPKDGEVPNLKYIGDYISKNVGKTTDSFFYTNGDTEKHYVSLFLDKPDDNPADC